MYVTKICKFYIYKQIRVSVIVYVDYKAANTNVQGKNDMLVLFSFASCPIGLLMIASLTHMNAYTKCRSFIQARSIAIQQ